METVNINKENALKAYKSADKKTKELLENLFGKEILSQNIMDRIKTFEDACNELEIKSISKNISFGFADSKDNESIEAYAKLCIIIRSLNEGWEPDWTNSNEYKYYPWFDSYKSGFGFSYSHYAYWYTITACGSRLCFKSPELAEYAGKQFLEIYNQFLTIK